MNSDLNLAAKEGYELLKDSTLLNSINLPSNVKKEGNENQGSFMLSSDSKTDRNENQGKFYFGYGGEVT